MTHYEIIQALQDHKLPSTLIHEISASIYRLYDNIERAQEQIGYLRAENAARAEKIKLMRSREEAYDNRIERLLAENAALRARIDDCAAALMADAEGR